MVRTRTTVLKVDDHAVEGSTASSLWEGFDQGPLEHNKSKLDITGNNSLQDRFETRTVIREPSDMRDKLMNLFIFSSKLSFVGEVLSFAATTEAYSHGASTKSRCGVKPQTLADELHRHTGEFTKSDEATSPLSPLTCPHVSVSNVPSGP
ncbi:LOW QUALITY PROTEIN: hypothetical protein YC2023_006256 [Brassica napus]